MGNTNQQNINVALNLKAKLEHYINETNTKWIKSFELDKAANGWTADTKMLDKFVKNERALKNFSNDYYEVIKYWDIYNHTNVKAGIDKEINDEIAAFKNLKSGKITSLEKELIKAYMVSRYVYSIFDYMTGTLDDLYKASNKSVGNTWYNYGRNLNQKVANKIYLTIKQIKQSNNR